MKHLFVFVVLMALPRMVSANEHIQRSAYGKDMSIGERKTPFLTTRIEDDQILLTLPEEVLDSPMMFVRHDHGNQPKFMQVMWALERDNILLKVPSIWSTSGITLPIKPRLDVTDNILAVFPLVNTNGGQASYTINITKLVLTQMIEWEPGFTETVVPEISLLMGSKDLDNEVIIKVRRGLVLDRSKVSIPVYFGICALPEPMKSRQFDYRMGFYDEESTGIHFHMRNSLANIARWRMEKKYKDQKISVPIKPITFVLSPDIPKKWRPYIKAGIEEWLPAFESAGFKDALIVKEVDSLDEWQAHSIHSNVVQWSQKKYLRGSEYEDYGGTVAKIIDYRTGEVLRGDILMGASERTVMEQYFVRAAPLDKRAQQFPFPDTLTGKLFQVIAAHETGHIFGLKDGNYGEYTYPWDKMNDSTWLRTMGHTPSVMNYTRANNIAQPEDSIPPSLLLRRVGPTDRYNIRWAYTEFPEGTSMKQEQEALEQMIRWQDTVPWYRFVNPTFEVLGPAASNEVVETNDPVRSTTLALKNLERVIALLPKVTKDQKDNARLDRLYEKTVSLWKDHMKHVMTLVGGYDVQYKSIGHDGNQYTPIPWEKQLEALEFLLANAFNPPEWLTEPNFYKGARYSTYTDRVMVYQSGLAMELLMAPRLNRLEYLEDFLGQENLIKTYLSTLRDGLFSELYHDAERAGSRRLNLQSIYIEQLIRAFGKERKGYATEERFYAYSDQMKALILEELMVLKKDMEKGMKSKRKDTMRWHWELCIKKINGAF
ncbi:zinc-dependent metalloprotease [Allomuricauda taeanensis]|uniref:zinc-dependent metalloprotease n=1 Tax=Flagellimonas taeanensis TaxID=1005926 RepID=UPI002E7BD0F4|nr:zinc-dependent metalloprotease [Allomuricauda taeanensis]MEE1962051.1 zinc-dependent metalloprotease [Allomuricauda taeanensis]